MMVVWDGREDWVVCWNQITGEARLCCDTSQRENIRFKKWCGKPRHSAGQESGRAKRRQGEWGTSDRMKMKPVRTAGQRWLDNNTRADWGQEK